jgi:hypothetical protein
MGTRLPKCSSPSFAEKVEGTIPAELRDALLPLVRMATALSDCIQEYDEKIEKLGREKYGHTALLRQVKGGRTDHVAGLRIDLGESRTIRKESGCGAVSGTSAEAGRLRGEPTAIRNQQNRRHDGAQAAGGERALYFGAVRTGYGLTTVWAATLRAWWEECEEESGSSGGAEARRLTALPLGEWRSI